MTRAILYPYFCEGCQKEKACHDDCSECELFTSACENLDLILEKESFIGVYRACEGDVRVITSIGGNQKRYTISEDGKFKQKL